MKMMPESSDSLLLNQSTAQRLKLDSGALCFFSLGMFLAASTVHLLGWF